MPYLEFKNGIEGDTPINAQNLNLMQELIEGQSGMTGDTMPVGSIIPYASDTIPTNWLKCDGTAISRTDYSLLFSIIGTTYGEGDGSTTFNLPNFNGKVPVGVDNTQTEFATMGKTGGEKTHTLTIDEMPSHNHTVPIGSFVNTDQQTNAITNGHISPTSQQVNYDTTSTGEGQPHNILQPYITVNYIIKYGQSAGVMANVVDNLNSTSETDALSANQGKILDSKINKLVKDYTLPADASSITVSGLNFANDGDVYEIFIKIKQNIISATQCGLRINGLTSNIYNYAGFAVAGATSEIRNIYGANTDYYRLGAIRGTYSSFCRLTIRREDFSRTKYTIVSDMFAEGTDMNVEHIMGEVILDNISNLTSINIFLPLTENSFAAGKTNIKVYKKY